MLLLLLLGDTMHKDALAGWRWVLSVCWAPAAGPVVMLLSLLLCVCDGQGTVTHSAFRDFTPSPCCVSPLPPPPSLLQIPKVRPAELARLAKSERTVSRAYGGSRCAGCTRSRILRAFIIEEQKIVKKVLLEKMKSAGKAE